METMHAVDSTAPIHQKPSHYDEISMQQSLYFGDSLKDLKNLRMQLYSAADYFEVSYTNNDQKYFVAEALKEYAIKAVVNTVDHLGSVSYKVNGILDENVEEVSETEFCVSCIEQRLRTCQEYIDREGVAQQSSVINTPRHHKRYTLPDGGGCSNNVKFKEYQPKDMNDWHQFRTSVQPMVREVPPTVREVPPNVREVPPTVREVPPTVRDVHPKVREAPPSTSRKGRSVSPSVRHSKRDPVLPSARPSVGLQPAETFPSTAACCPKKELGKLERRSVSPHRFPLLSRSGSLATTRPASKSSSRSTTPNHRAVERQRFPSAPRRSTSMHVQKARESEQKEPQRAPSRSKRLLMALLSRKKSKKDDTLYTYLDEY